MLLKDKEIEKLSYLYTFGNDGIAYRDKFYNAYLIFKNEKKTKEYIDAYGMGKQNIYRVRLNPCNLFSINKKNDATKIGRYYRMNGINKHFNDALDELGYVGIIELDAGDKTIQETRYILENFNIIKIFNGNYMKVATETDG